MTCVLLSSLLIALQVPAAPPQIPTTPRVPAPKHSLAASQIPGLALVDNPGGHDEVATDPEKTSRWSQPAFMNDTDFEIASVTVRLRVLEGKRTTFLGQPHVIKRMFSGVLGTIGSLLPRMSGSTVEVQRDEYEGRHWNTESEEKMEIVSAEVYGEKQNLRNLLHFYTWLHRTPPDQAVEALRKDPSVLSTPGVRDLDHPTIAFAVARASVLRTILDLGPKPKPVFPKSRSNLLDIAANNPDEGVWETALALGAPLDGLSTGNMTPVMYAIMAKNLPFLRWLLKKGADPKSSGAGGLSAARLAVFSHRVPFLEAVVATGIDVVHEREPGGMGLLQTAASDRDCPPEMLARLLAYGIPVDDAEPLVGITPLMMAALSQAYDNAAWFVRHGASFDRRDVRGLGVWDYARRSNTLRSDRLLRRALKERGIVAPPERPGSVPSKKPARA